MFRRILFATIIGMLLWTTPALAKKTTPRVCLAHGSYLVAKKGSNIFLAKMDVGLAREVYRIQIRLTGGSLDEHIVANDCDVFFAWTKPGGQSEIWAIAATNGWNLRKITRTPEKAEVDPVFDPWNMHLAFVEIGQDMVPYVVSTNLKGHDRKVEAKNATAPAWGSALTYTQSGNGRIHIWNTEGSWHTYWPDGMGILVQDGPYFISVPVVGVPRVFAIARSVAFRPEGNLAAVITTDGDLVIQPVDSDWRPFGSPVPVPGFPSNLSFVAWISVPYVP